MNDIIINKFKRADLRPRASWKQQTRERLQEAITADFKEHEIEQNFSIFDYVKILLPEELPFRVSAVVVTMFIVVLGGYITTVKAAKNSLPGEPLYAIKRADEEIRKAVVTIFQEERVGELELIFAHRRIAEAQQIVRGPENTESKREKVKAVVAEVQTHVEKAKNEVVNLSSRGQVAKAHALATKVESEAKTINLALNDKQNDLSSLTTQQVTLPLIKIAFHEDVQDVIEATTASVDKSVSQANDVIVEQYLSGKSSLTLAEIRAKITTKIEEIAQLSEPAQQTQEIPLVTSEISTPPSKDETHRVVVDEEALSNVVNKPALQAKIEIKLNEAKEFLNKGDIANAFQRVKEADALAATVRAGEDAISIPTVSSSVPETIPIIDETSTNITETTATGDVAKNENSVSETTTPTASPESVGTLESEKK